MKAGGNGPHEGQRRAHGGQLDEHRRVRHERARAAQSCCVAAERASRIEHVLSLFGDRRMLLPALPIVEIARALAAADDELDREAAAATAPGLGLWPMTRPARRERTRRTLPTEQWRLRIRCFARPRGRPITPGTRRTGGGGEGGGGGGGGGEAVVAAAGAEAEVAEAVAAGRWWGRRRWRRRRRRLRASEDATAGGSGVDVSLGVDRQRRDGPAAGGRS